MLTNQTAATQTRASWILVVFCFVLLSSCARDPHKNVVTSEHFDDFSNVASGANGLTDEEMALLKAAESRARTSKAPRQFVGKTIESVISDERRWQEERRQLEAKFEPVYRSAKALQASTAVGVTLIRYRELLEALATEINISNDKLATEDERAVAALFRSTLQSYQDAGTLWQHSIESARYEWYKGEIGYTVKNIPPEPEMKRIAEAYQLPIHDRKIESIDASFQSLPNSSIQTVWQVASARADQAIQAYKGK